MEEKNRNRFNYKKQTMNVKDLKDVLSNLPDEMEIILQKDGEGNGYSPLEGADAENVYIADSTWSGDVYPMNWTSDDACMTDEEWDAVKEKPRALILYPVN